MFARLDQGTASTSRADASRLLLDIARCSNVTACLKSPEIKHPCASIVRSQNPEDSPHQYPEPWNGHLATAPILFLGSNPSLNPDEDRVDAFGPDASIIQAYEGLFDTEDQPDPSIRVRLANGSLGPWVRYWAGVRARATELLGRRAQLGVDCALSEVVHCKSKSEVGVRDALDECARRYLDRLLWVTGARVIVVLGTIAGQVLRQKFAVPPDALVFGPHEICGRIRILAFLPHPNAHKQRSFATSIRPEQVDALRTFLAVSS